MSGAILAALELSRGQQSRLDSVLALQVEGLNAIRAEVNPRMDSLVLQTRASIDSILTPTQRTRLREIQRDADAFRGGERRGRGDGLRGPPLPPRAGGGGG
jgi:hypothetical protein